MIPMVFFPDLNRESFCRKSTCIYVVNLKRKIITTGKVTNGIWLQVEEDQRIR